MDTDSDSSNTTFDTLEVSDFDIIEASVAPRDIAPVTDVDARLSFNIDIEEEPDRLHMNAVKPEECTTALHSLVPILELLSAWKEVDGYFMLAGDITDDDISRLYESSRKVIEFVYPGGANNSDAPMISPDIYLRLSQRIGGAPLLPYLYRLRLLSISTEMTYLPFLFSSNLTFLEIQNISPSASHLAKSFLAALPYEAPGLQSLELHGTHQLPAITLYPIADLKQLRLLELNDVIRMDDLSLLERLSRLPYLTTFSFVSHNLSLVSSLSEHAVCTAGFEKLKSLSVTGSFMLIQKAVTLVSSRELEVLQLVPVAHSEELRLLVHAKKVQLHSRHEREVTEQLTAEERTEMNHEELTQQIYALKKELSNAEGNLLMAIRESKDKRIMKKTMKLSAIGASEEKKEAARSVIENSSPTSTKKVNDANAALLPLVYKLRALEMALLNLQAVGSTSPKSSGSSLDLSPTRASIADKEPSTVLTASQPTGGWSDLLKQTIDFLTSQWADSLQDLTLGLDDQHSSLSASHHAFALPESFFLSFECLHALELLIIEKWSVVGLSFSLPQVVKGWPRIRTLHLPLEHRPGVGLDVLRAIADSCAELRSLKLSIDLSCLPPLSEECGASFALRHELNILSVNSFCGFSHGKKGIILIARYLNILFPYLMMEFASMTNFQEVSEMWKEVYEFVQAFQLVREDERNRV